jgi:Protein of unknown function (DUF2846)
MRSVLVVMILAVCVLAQDQSGRVTAACGPTGVSYVVKRDETQHTLTPPEPGKARVYFVRDIGMMKCLGSCGTTKIGLDGKWVGANQRNSYFSVSVEPGEHHVCANDGGETFAFAHFSAEAGKVYYFRTRSSSEEYQKLFDMDSMDSDQGKYLIGLYPLSISSPKP